ncbi:MAG: hypothetical protein JW734_05410 [Candidatus Omnitrophica bacterium]|nr:hypothetical protein [Candidatus Omnitrophota bacterium]
MIAEVAIGLEIKKSFDYQAEAFAGLKRGSRVLVDFNNKKRVGFVVNIKKKQRVKFRLKPILAVLDRTAAFTENLLDFSKEVSLNYLYSQGDILEMMLPLALRKGRYFDESFLCRTNPRVPSDSGKITYIRENINTHVRFSNYREIVLKARRENKKVIICVPQKDDAFTVKNFLENNIADLKIALLFGSQAPSLQLKEWIRVRTQEADVCIGTRFAIFAPFINIETIIVEKENFYGYFQPEKPFYHLRDLSIMRAKLERSGLVLHSDFPSIWVYKSLKEKKLKFLDLSSENFPKAKIFDLKDYSFKGYPVFSHLIQELIRKYLQDQKKVILFWNRKGFSHLLRCNICGEVLKCPKCSNFLSFSIDAKSYLCSKCGFKRESRARCYKCKKGYIKNIGTGIERVESIFSKIFPDKKITTLSKGKYLKQKEWDILISTQRLIFLETIPQAELLVVSGLDFMSSQGDYTSSLELFFLVKRLKSLAKEEFVLFTFNPGYYPIAALNQDWPWFYERELKQRKSLKFPPYFHVAKVGMRQKTQSSLLKNITSFKTVLEQTSAASNNIHIYGPIEDSPFKRSGTFHYFLFIKAKRIDVLRKALDKTISKFRKSSAKISLIIQ